VSVRVSILLKHKNENNGGLCVVSEYYKGSSIRHDFLSVTKGGMNLIGSGVTTGSTKFAVLDSRRLL
jgi:3-deoxy-D-arabino-heptulosonate 7-phosphate (DAHP) synthase